MSGFAIKKEEMNILVLDNGAGTVKVGWASDGTSPKCIPNVTAKVNKSMEYFVGDKIDQCLNGSQLIFTRPFDRGYLNNWKCELDIWTYIFNEQMVCNCQQTSLVLTEPIINLSTIQTETNEIVFEYFGFKE